MNLFFVQYRVNSLRNPNDKYHDTIHNYLALEFTLQFPYYEKLVKICKNADDRETLTQELYHGFFQMSADAIKKGFNLSYFRGFDRARKRFSERAALKEKEAGRIFEDPYLDAYMDNNKDGNDSYLIHLAVCGFWFNNLNYRVLNFTLDSPNVVKKRVEYCYYLLKWINEHMGYPFALCPGVVYCFNEALELIQKIDVKELDNQKQ